MTSLRWIAAPLLALPLLACARQTRPTSTPAPPETAAPLSVMILGGSGGELTGDDALDRLFEAPEVIAAGERLLERLGDDPSLQPLYGDFLKNLLQQPALLKSLTRVAAADPDASVEGVSAQVAERLAEGIDGPAFDAALDASLDRLLDRPDVDVAFERLADRMLERGYFVERVTVLLLQWQPDLEEVVGVSMIDDRFEDLLQRHLDEPARTRALESLLTERVADDPGVRASLAALLDDDELYAACAVLIDDVLSSPGFLSGSTDVFAGMIEEVDAADLNRRVDQLLVTPQIEQAVVHWVDRISLSPAFDDLAVQLGSLLDDPSFQAELYSALVGMPRSRTA